jgi:hypothetical protein
MRGVLGVLATLLFLVGGTLLAIFLGGHRERCAGKVKFAAIGIVHSTMQLTLPAALVCYATPIGVGLVIGLQVACSVAVGALTRMSSESAVSVRKRPTAKCVTITLLWAVQWVGSIALLASCATNPSQPSLAWWLVPVVVATGMIVCIHEFGWYLLVAFVWGGHNNEAGTAIRCQHYKEWIRFHIDSDGTLTGYVIGVDTAIRAATGGPVPNARVVDVFRMAPETMAERRRRAERGSRDAGEQHER